MPKLVVEKGPDKGKFITIGGKETTVIIGRDTTAHLRLTDSMASRFHFKIETRPEGFYLIDLDSLNGTFVNGQRVKESLLQIGDKIQIGETLFSFLAEVETQKLGPIGQIIGGCKIIERIGRGGMGTVYKAIQLSLNRILALKLLSEEFVRDKTFINLFMQEARSAAQLNHPNIVQVYDVGREENIYYISMEFVPGGNLQDLLMREKKLPVEKALEIILQAAHGLEYAEKKGIVHCDIKPDNLMIGEDGVIKIGDLGLARHLKTSFSEQFEGGVFGTPHYVAPEQALGKPIDHRVDIYSLGATFYRMLTGVTPYPGSSIKEIITKKIKEDPRPIRELNPQVPESISEIVHRMLKRNPDERYQHVAELIQDLEQAKKELSAPYFIAETEEIYKPLERFGYLVISLLLVLLTSLSIFALVRYYYTHIRKPAESPTELVNKTNQKPPESTVSIHEERLAAKYFKEAEYFVQQMPWDDINFIKKAIQLYELIINECPNSTLVPAAKEKIKALLDHRVRLEKQEHQRIREAEATQKYNELITSLNQEFQFIVENTLLTRVDYFLNKANELLEEFKSNYADTSLVEQATKKIEELAQWKKRFKKAEEKYTSIDQMIQIALEQGVFKEAIKLLEDFINNLDYQGTLYDNIARSRLDLVIRQAKDDYQRKVVNPAYEMLKDKKFDQAREVFKKAIGIYGLAEIEDKIKSELDNIERLIETHQKEEYLRLLQADQKLFYPKFAQALALAYEGLFDGLSGAINTLEKIKFNLNTKEYQTKLKETIWEIEAEKKIIQALQERINQKQLRVDLFRGKPILKADSSGITVEISFAGGKGTRVYSWKEITSEELYNLINFGWTLTAEEALRLGILCLRRGNFVQAKEAFERAFKILKEQDDPLAQTITNYQKRLLDEPSRQEKEAKLIFQYANILVVEKDYYTALKCFLTLEQRYFFTKIYNQNQLQIKEGINTCKKELR